MDKLEWACRDYCLCLYKLEQCEDYEEQRQIAHNEIEKLTGQRFDEILHNLEMFEVKVGSEYYFLQLARLIRSVIESNKNT